jgi:uncharacterized protein (TIGR00290 family)
LALYEAKLLGYKIKSLTTFIPKNVKFLAHPIKFMKYQAKCLNIPHYTVKIIEPFKESYENAIQTLNEKLGINVLITGDIAEVNGHPNWIEECSEYSNIDVFSPLWGIDRYELIQKFLLYKFKAIFSCVKKPWFTEEWLGKTLNEDSLELLVKLHVETGLDICGENGEYHTLVLNGPIFNKSIFINKYNKNIKDSIFYIDLKKVSLKKKKNLNL